MTYTHKADDTLKRIRDDMRGLQHGHDVASSGDSHCERDGSSSHEYNDSLPRIRAIYSEYRKVQPELPAWAHIDRSFAASG